ncbi:MraY family glycosyltransferase [Sulfolobus acidocaldarius]|uniref:Putative UDP-N-acetylglucosamine--dolichyl-phosphate N-acetylglucosaminephosphotransferase n=4 Tax=Sulfolobus acidocaldarius TaxID=2285 RepID=GPT_SULAC|nr:glycosyltransferase 4 family protein [Sulfolobus acidocaldarius]P39465.1 RecName: Full=Putative UDP-N-acetylglucosamine--dolichyl-phosphate N-acetylglucosaminephosphotransferase; AltName: Full=GlcNAc-1-P transferase; Short=G1PT; Short=GPT; AltName: Full=N-acetylglucosamine-1-phosphate transferase [Sulfolobus acidocaldarius DSM 639]AAY79520.1 UDP-N-acetylglucosamine-dolichyl-phosphate N-acetylglucosaminephosphotransferase [Sulfolobus acidocaldarius DSM 639]AGE70070.1 UDP-N-acetylglucosamine-do
MLVSLLGILLSVIVGFVVTLISTKWVIGLCKKRGFTGKDINKLTKDDVPVLGGIGIVAGFVAGSFTFLLTSYNLSPGIENVVVSILLSSLIIGFLGLLDDIFNISQATRAFLPIFASIPLILYSVGHTIISIPFLGKVNFGILFYIIILPATLTITANAFNMLEGLNGLGAGMGLIMALALAYIGLKSGGTSFYAGIVSIILASVLFGFLIFNFYPAKTFPGNIGTYFIGSVIGSIGISGYMYTALFFLYLPYVIEFVLKAKTRFKGVSFGKIDDQGYLHWDSKPNSLTHIVMRIGKFKEYHIVLIIWGIEILFAILAVVFQTVTITI